VNILIEDDNELGIFIRNKEYKERRRRIYNTRIGSALPVCHQRWLFIFMSWVRFPALPDFLRSSGSGMGFT
jgi:hypothetical protein